MARAGPKKWSYRGGTRPNTVTVAERTSGGIIYAKAWNSSTGQYIRVSLGHRDREAAELYADEEALKLRKGESEIRSGRVTLTRVFDLYERHKTPTKSEKAQEEDRRRFELWMSHLGPRHDPHAITMHQWAEFARLRLAGEVNAKGEPVPKGDWKPLRPRTVEKEQRFLHAVYRWAWMWKPQPGFPSLMRENPLRSRDLFPFEKEENPYRPTATEDRYLRTRTHAESVVAHVWWTGERTKQKSDLLEILDIVHGTGRRIRAILALRFADLRLERTTEAPHGAIMWPGDTDKQGKAWASEMTREVRAAIDRVMTRRPDRAGTLPLFPSPTDPDMLRSVSYERASCWLRRAEMLAGLEKLKHGLWHPYRRKWATERKHHPDKDVAEVGGWKSTETLRRCYQQSDPETRRQVLEDRRPVLAVS
ncbi:MAG: tyrosine-type recombinase/integrase [Gemmatimonadetes bacterium]|nr:tyrosine-type recombinase/integrase [Gemmatimonadota bacterium]